MIILYMTESQVLYFINRFSLETPKRVAFIQGTRSVGSSIWLADDGTSLPYLSSVVANQAISTATVMSLGKFFTAVDPTDLQGNYFCEI